MSEDPKELAQFEHWWNKEYCGGYIDLSHYSVAMRAWTAARASQWQDIETAPKDGTRILIDGETWARVDSPEIAFWDGEHWNAADICYDHDEPTHWQPLPQPPVSK